MSEVPIEINFTSGRNAIGFLLLLNGALKAMAESILHLARKSEQLRNTLDSPNKTPVETLDTLQKPYSVGVHPLENVLGLACLKNTNLHMFELEQLTGNRSDLEGNQ